MAQCPPKFLQLPSSGDWAFVETLDLDSENNSFEFVSVAQTVAEFTIEAGADTAPLRMVIPIDFLLSESFLHGAISVRVIVQSAGRLYCAVDTTQFRRRNDEAIASYRIWQPPDLAHEQEDQCEIGLELTCILERERILFPDCSDPDKNFIDLKFKKVVVEFAEKDLDYDVTLPLLYCRHMPRKERFLHLTDLFIGRNLSLD
jgi:hypothetical protein